MRLRCTVPVTVKGHVRSSRHWLGEERIFDGSKQARQLLKDITG